MPTDFCFSHKVLLSEIDKKTKLAFLPKPNVVNDSTIIDQKLLLSATAIE